MILGHTQFRTPLFYNSGPSSIIPPALETKDAVSGER